MTGKSTAAWESSPKGLLPIVIGVTGHLDVVPNEEMTRGVLDIFNYLKTAYPHTPLVLLSPLAAGADQFVAELAVKSKIRLIVPMPMPRPLYENDFKDSALLAKYKTLRDQAELIVELPLREGFREEDVPEGSDARNFQYARVGAYIVSHSQLLIALWDGLPSTAEGGTGHIVPFMLEGIPEPYDPAYNPVDLPERGPVYHVLIQRKTFNGSVEPSSYHDQFPKTYPHLSGNPAQQGSRGATFHIDYPKIYKDRKHAERVYNSLLNKVDAFNRDFLTECTEKRRIESGRLFYTGNVARADIEGIREHYIAADSLAQKYHQDTLRVFRALPVIIFFAAALFELFAHGIWHEYPALLLYSGLLIIASITYYMALRDDRQNKHQDYRALAEGLRVQFFWRLSGLEDSVADYYLQKQRSEMDWVPKAIRVWNVRPIRTKDKQHARHDWQRMEEILNHWIRKQADYYEKASHRDDRNLSRLRTARFGLLALSFLMTLLFLALYEQLKEHSHFILYTISVSSVLGAMAHGYIEKMAFSEHVKQYERMAGLFSHAAGKLQGFIDSKNAEKCYRLIIDLGKEALIEHGDWLFLHRERPIEIPQK